MVLKIIWSPLALQSYLNNIAYLERAWTKKEVTNFIKSTEEKLELLKKFPGMGYSSQKNRFLKKTLIGKRIILIYRYKPAKNKIELMRFFNTWQDPRLSPEVV
ncbi:MAG: type II toxin-antitoxin system RelE/ParE family toxin [Ginsengibacter sp.]